TCRARPGSGRRSRRPPSRRAAAAKGARCCAGASGTPRGCRFRLPRKDRINGKEDILAAVEELSYGFDLMGVDPASLGSALASAAAGLARRPAQLAQATAGLALEEGAVALDAARRLLDVEVEPRVEPAKG